MKGIISTLVEIGFIGIIVLLCLFSYKLASKSDEFWDKVKKHMENEDERH